MLLLERGNPSTNYNDSNTSKHTRSLEDEILSCMARNKDMWTFLVTMYMLLNTKNEKIEPACLSVWCTCVSCVRNDPTLVLAYTSYTVCSLLASR